MILVEGNAQKWMVVEMGSDGMEALVRAKASVEMMFILVDWRGVLNWTQLWVGLLEVDDVERLAASRVRLWWWWGLGGCAWDSMLRWVDVCEARSSLLARRSGERSVVMDMSVGGRSLFGGVMGWLFGRRQRRERARGLTDKKFK